MRKLTETEILNLLLEVGKHGKLNFQLLDITRLQLGYLRLLLLKELKDVKIRTDINGEVNEETRITDFNRRFIERFNRAIINVGSPVGIWASHAFSQEATQATLSSFHKAGSFQSSAGGFPRIEAILNASRTVSSNSSGILIPRKRSTFVEIMFHRGDYVSTNMMSMLVRQDITARPQKLPEWAKTFLEVYNIELPETQQVVRLDFSSLAMMEARTTSSDIRAVFTSQGSKMYTAIFSPPLLHCSSPVLHLSEPERSDCLLGQRDETY